MTTLMILQDGPLDGETQIVESLPSAEGATMFFNIPVYQSFDQAGNVIARGLECTYAYLREGPPPDATDTWAWSAVLGYKGEAFLPPYPSGALYPTVSVLEPNSAPVGIPVTLSLLGSGLLSLTNVYLPLSFEPNDTRPVTSLTVVNDSSATIIVPGVPEGLYDLSLAYAGGFVRYTAAFSVGP